jgi:3'(2'), 5'-bisphosphate nucleotidase
LTVTDARLAAGIAAEAGDLLLRLRGSDLTGKELGRAGDRQANELILARLGADRPHDAVLSEESADSPDRLTSDRVWIVDPLDGTREYGLAGRSDWAVHVALWVAGKGIASAAVAQPALGAVYATDDPRPAGGGSGGSGGSGGGSAEGAAGAGSSGAGSPGPGPVILVSDSRPPDFAAAVAAAVAGSLQPMGSAGAKAMAVLRGEADAYLHAGGQWEWDSAAPVGILLAAGFHASRIDGSPLEYNQPHPYLPDLLICRPQLAEALLAALARGPG